MGVRHALAHATLAVAAALAVCGAAPARAGALAPQQDEMRNVPLHDLLARGDEAAIAELRRRFDQSGSKLDRQRIASVLVRLLDDDGPYWDFLVSHARPAVESDMPFPYAFDLDGKIAPRQYSPAFLSWANRARVAPDSAAGYALNDAPLDVLMLVLTDDPRGRELLRTGVGSPNFLVAYRSAWGLARLRDTAAVPRIVAAAEALPADGAEMVARALLLFLDSPQAQAAADRLIPDARTREALRSRAGLELRMNIGDRP